MSLSNSRRETRLEFAALCVWLFLGLALAIIAFVQYGKDFRGYYAAARVLLDGKNPYDYNLVANVLEEVTGFQGNNPYYYPPWFAWMFVPLAPLPFTIARAIWMLINYLLWNLTLLRLPGALGVSLRGWRIYGIFALTTFSFAWITWRYEQAGILVVAILVELLLSLQAGKWTRAGVWLAIMTVKPNVTLIIAVGISLWMFRMKIWKPILVASLVTFVLLAASTLMTPDWYRPLFEKGFGAGLNHVLDGPDRVVAFRINSTLPDWLATLGVTHRARNMTYAGLSLLGLVYLIKISAAGSLVQVTNVSILVSLALTPYALQYDYPVLVIPFILGISIQPATRHGIKFGALLAAFVLSVIFWQRNIAWAYWMVVGLLALHTWGFWELKVAAKRQEHEIPGTDR